MVISVLLHVLDHLVERLRLFLVLLSCLSEHLSESAVLLKVVAELVWLHSRLSEHVIATFPLHIGHRHNVWFVGALELFKHLGFLLIGLQLLHKLHLFPVVLDPLVLLHVELTVVSPQVSEIRAVLLHETHGHQLKFWLGHDFELIPPSAIVVDIVLLTFESDKALSSIHVSLLLADTLFEHFLLCL